MQTARRTANPLTEVVLAIRAAMAGSVDAYLLTGALLEAIAQILSTKIPPELRSATELATVVLLKQRLASTRIVCGGPPDYCNPAPETI
jgi:hypothetical protein